jgi:thiol-disulfide isomerase/thioredoxin
MPTNGSLRVIRPQLIQPANWDALSAEEKAKITAAFRESDVYKAYMAKPQEYAVTVAPDGAFRAADVPAGNYILDFYLLARSKEDPSYFGLTAEAAMSVAVPEIPGGKSDEPLDVGSLEMRPVGKPKAGDPAPAFEMAMYDGTRTSMAALKGKYVLIDFWATWCGPSIAQMPHLAELQKSLAADPRFVLLSVSTDDRIDEPRAYLKAHPMPWMQAWSGTLDASPARLAFGVAGIRSLWLIGPDGRVLMRPSEAAMEETYQVLGAGGQVEKKPRSDESLDAIVKGFLGAK